MSYTPANVGYAVASLENYSRNRYKLIPTSADTLRPNGQLNIPLPEGSICDMRSLRLYFKVTATGATNGTDTVFARLPADSSSFFSRMVVNLNGVQINGSSSEWNSYCKMSKICRTSYDKDQSIDRALQHGSISFAGADETAKMALCDWDGTFFGTSSTRFVHTGMLGSIVLTGTLAGNDILVPAGAGGSKTLTPAEQAIASGISYTISEIYATIDCISLSPLYDELLMTRLAQEDISINYKEIYSFAQEGITSGSSTSRFSLATRSLDKVFGTFRRGDHQTVGIPSYALVDTVGDADVSNKFRFGVYDVVANQQVKHQFSINNTPYPQYRADTLMEGIADSSYAVEEDDIGVKSRGNLVMSQADFNDGKGVVALRLNHPTGMKPETAVASGLSTLGVNMSATWDITGQTGLPAGVGVSSLVVCETTPKLTISAGKQVSVAF